MGRTGGTRKHRQEVVAQKFMCVRVQENHNLVIEIINR
jgi:hypothetical protein